MRPYGLIFCTNPTTNAIAPDFRLRENDKLQIKPVFTPKKPFPALRPGRHRCYLCDSFASDSFSSRTFSSERCEYLTIFSIGSLSASMARAISSRSLSRPLASALSQISASIASSACLSNICSSKALSSSGLIRLTRKRLRASLKIGSFDSGTSSGPPSGHLLFHLLNRATQDLAFLSTYKSHLLRLYKIL